MEASRLWKHLDETFPELPFRLCAPLRFGDARFGNRSQGVYFSSYVCYLITPYDMYDILLLRDWSVGARAALFVSLIILFLV